MTIRNRLHEVHVRILEFIWLLVLPRPRKRQHWWQSYLDIDEQKPFDPISAQIVWSEVMNRRYGPLFGEYNPYLDEETRKKMVVRPDGPINKAFYCLGSLIPDKTESEDTHND